MSSGAPWWAFLVTATIAGLALLVSIFSVWRSDRRETEKWKRETLTKAISALVATSESRAEKHYYARKFYEGPSLSDETIVSLTELERKMRIELTQVKICGNSKIYEAALALYMPHAEHEVNLFQIHQFDGHLTLDTFDADSIFNLRDDLISTLQRELKISPQ